jgi:hypothetical protein
MKLREWTYSTREIFRSLSKTHRARVYSYTYQLISEQQDSLKGELPVAEVEEIFEGGTEQVQHHGIVVAFGTEPPHKGYTDTSSEGLVNLGFVLELRMLSLDRFELDGDLFPRDDVDPEIDITLERESTMLICC